MFLNSWSLALILCSLMTLVLMALAGRTALRVLRFWNPSSDSNLQIRLESETWLASTLVEYALGFQILSLVLFVLAADHFCDAIAGAMCATGSLLANEYGIPALLVKIGGVFLYGFWIVLHQLDIRCETYPLVRGKYRYLLFLLPVLLTDIYLQTAYIGALKPDIITSCCAVVFSSVAGEGRNIMAGMDQEGMLAVFYGTVAVLAVLGVVLGRQWNRWLAALFAGGWVWFFGLALVMIITVFSSYIYAMPYHNCPFCILKPEYHYIGFAIYGMLIPAAFFGVSGAAVQPFRALKGLREPVVRFQEFAVLVSVGLLVAFAGLCSYHLLKYLIAGGES